jgi:hypothetical protein
MNRGDGRFEERGLLAGVARDDRGNSDGSMGLDAADYDGSGRASLWVTNFEDQLHSLFRNGSSGRREHFTYFSPDAGIARLGRSYVGWGTGFFDFDNDGWEDLVVGNGHVFRHAQGGMAQKPILLKNQPHPKRDGERWFANITAQGGSYFQQVHRGRGLVIGDLDNDGYPDLVISHINEPVTLLRNEAERSHHWLGVEPIGRPRRDIVGTKLTLDIDGRRLTRFAKGGRKLLILERSPFVVRTGYVCEIEPAHHRLAVRQNRTLGRSRIQPLPSHRGRNGNRRIKLGKRSNHETHEIHEKKNGMRRGRLLWISLTCISCLCYGSHSSALLAFSLSFFSCVSCVSWFLSFPFGRRSSSNFFRARASSGLICSEARRCSAA